MPILRRLRRVRMIVDIVDCGFCLEKGKPGEERIGQSNNNGEVE